MTDAPATLRPLRGAARTLRGRYELDWEGRHYVVDAGYLDLDERIHLYRDGQLIDSARRRARFSVGDGVRIEAAVAKIGMKYVRLRRAGARETEPFRPMPGTAEAWRASLDEQHPTTSRVVGALATVVLVATLMLELPQLVNLVGLFTPQVGLPRLDIPMISLSAWQNATVIVVGGLAAVERGLSLKHTPLLDD